jgi:UDP-N-acetylmuramoylalanine--D-glutamate ligase
MDPGDGGSHFFRIFFFSRQSTLAAGAFVADGEIRLRWTAGAEDLPVADMKLFGGHNVENALGLAVRRTWRRVAGQHGESADLVHGSRTPDRAVATLNGVPYYNDSKATNPESSIKALEAFDGHII